MTHSLLLLFLVSICSCTTALAQKSKVKTKKVDAQLSKAEKMGYARTNKYWGPATFYSFAPGKPNNKMANTKESAMRDLTGLTSDDFHTEITKQGFVAVPPSEVKRWFNDNNSKNKKFYYAPDKSYILFPSIKTMDRSSSMPDGSKALASSSMTRYVLIPKQDSLRVLDSICQYLRDLNQMKVMLTYYSSKFKRSQSEVYPFEQAEASNWTSFRAGSWVQKMVDGKPKNYWERHEDIVRRTMGKPDFDLWIHGEELEFVYGMHVMLQKEGYILSYQLVALTLGDLEPGSNWRKEHQFLEAHYNAILKIDKQALDQYKGKLPPNIESLDKLLHLK